jgi:putative ABC transport system substrate-binding protein
MTLKRRDFIALLGGAAAWPLAARAQQAACGASACSCRMKTIPLSVSSPHSLRRLRTWVGPMCRNLRINFRGAETSIGIRALAQELVGLQPDIILTGGSLATAAVQRETRTIPIVFVGSVGDPVAIGIVERLNQPGGNITGFAFPEPTLGGKWLELLSEIAPGLKRAAIMFNPDFPAPSTFMPAFETAARSLKVVPIPR